VHIPSYGTSQNPVDSTAQGVHKMGYATFAGLVANSPLIDGVVVVVTARRSAFLEGDLQKLKDLKRDGTKPVFMWTYTLPSDRSVEILNEAGYPLFTGALARSAKEAEKAARALGRPAALKVQSADIPHKTEAGAVALAIAAEGAAAAYDTVLANARRFAPQAKIDGVLVQPMAKPGREVILGVNRDERWGPMLMVGLGGTLVEAMGDFALAPIPLDRNRALALIASLKAAAALGPWRGMPEADSAALADLMVKLAQFAVDHADDVAEIDLNPVIVHAKGEGVSVVDALIVKRHARAARRTAAE